VPRFYQISLRTILELVFVAALICAFLYWRNVPNPTPGRYQVHPVDGGKVLYIDTAIGQMWRSYPNATSTNDWNPVQPPIDVKK